VNAEYGMQNAEEAMFRLFSGFGIRHAAFSIDAGVFIICKSVGLYQLLSLA
jgi:hypothetical protein